MLPTRSRMTTSALFLMRSYMLRKGTPVQDVSQILGHSNISVTETYLRVDIEHMRLCSLSLEGLL